MISDIIKIDNINNFDPDKNTVIEASAGTGKTYTIKQIVPWLLAHTDFSLDQILMVTYTEKAAGEMRDRTRKSLHEISEKLKDETDVDAKKLKNKIDNEIEKIDDAPIFTIHSFCHKVMTENAAYSNCSKNLTLVDEDKEIETFIGKYIRDNVNDDDVLLYLYKKTKKSPKNSINDVFKYAIKKYYLDKNGKENPDVISLENLSTEEEESYKTFTQDINNIPDKQTSFIKRCFVIKNLKNVYMAWQQEKANKNQQTYIDMIKTVYDALTEPGSKLLSQLKKQYKYAIIDEFQDTNQLQWDIFKQIFTTDNEHHLTIVGDPKQSIFSFQGADSKVYGVATQYIQNNGGDKKVLETNFRSSESMIKATNILSQNPEICGLAQHSKFPTEQQPKDKQIKPALLNNDEIKPVHIINDPAENTIVSKIIDFCTPNTDGKTKLQIWDKGEYRNVDYGDFAVLVRDRKDANKLLSALTAKGIPFMWHKDSTLFSTKEAADWVALLSAIQAPDFNASNRDILRRALHTAFFDISLDKINDEKYNDILCHERQLLLKWRNLSETRKYAKLMNAILTDSGITKRLASYDKIQSLAKYNQIGNFILDNLVSKQGSITTVVKTLKQLKNKDTNTETEISVEKATDKKTVKISTIHSAKGLEYPIVFYFMKKKNQETSFVNIEHHDKGETVLSIKEVKSDEPDLKSLRYVAITRAASLLFIVNVKFSKKYAIEDPQKIIKQDPNLFDLCEAVSTKTNIQKVPTVQEPEPEKPGPISLAQKKLYKHSYTSLSHHKINVADTNENSDTLITEEEESQRIDKEEGLEASESISTKQYDTNSGVDIREGMYDPNNLAVISVDDSGKQYGTTVHEIFERINFVNYQEDLDQILDIYCQNHPTARSYNREMIKKMISNTMMANFPEIIGNHTTGKMFRLSCLSPKDKKSEIEFNFNPDLHGKNINKKTLLNYCNGFIDLLFVREINGKQIYSILDWKTDLFDNLKNYASYAHLKSHTDEIYAIQRVLYSYCLIKWLSQFYPEKSESENFNDHFGGIYYAYVRGCNGDTGNGIYAHTWQDYQTLEHAFNSIINDIYKKESANE